MHIQHVPAQNGCRKSRDQKRCFTLVEMLVVVAIIGILAALLMPGLHSAIASARGAECANRMRQFMHAENIYSSDYGGLIALATPDAFNNSIWYSWEHPLYNNKYLEDKGMLSCPLVKGRYESTDSFARYGGNISGGTTGNDKGLIPCLEPVSYMNMRVRVNKLTNNHALIADTWRVKSGKTSSQFYYFRHDNPASWDWAAIQLRHGQRVHLSFFDGHVEAADPSRVARCNIKYFYDSADALIGPIF